VTVGIVYALLRSFMSRFPGILSLSRRFLSIILWLAVGVGLILVVVQVPMDKWIEDQVRRGTPDSDRDRAAMQKEFEAAHLAPNSAAKENQLNNFMFLTLTIDQTVTTVLLF